MTLSRHYNRTATGRHNDVMYEVYRLWSGELKRDERNEIREVKREVKLIASRRKTFSIKHRKWRNKEGICVLTSAWYISLARKCKNDWVPKMTRARQAPIPSVSPTPFLLEYWVTRSPKVFWVAQFAKVSENYIYSNESEMFRAAKVPVYSKSWEGPWNWSYCAFADEAHIK